MHPIFLDDTDIYGVYFDFDYDASYNKSLAARAVLVEVTLTTLVYFSSQIGNMNTVYFILISSQVFYFAVLTCFFDDWDSKPKNFFNITILGICSPYLLGFLLLSMWEKKGDFWSNNDESSEKRS